MSLEFVPNRRSHGSYKWKKYPEDTLPLWVADMDFKVANCISEALQKAHEHALYGYTLPKKELIGTVINRLKDKYDWQVEASSIVWLPGVVPALNIACRAFVSKGENVITSTPIYPPFLEAPKFSEKTLYTADLKENDGNYEMDFDALKKKITDRTSLYLLCNPHNPVGKAFSKEELLKLAEICLDKNAIICSDEIHADLLLDENTLHTPIATLSQEIADRSVTLMSPSKTFNTPGLGFAFAVIPNYKVRKRFLRAMKGIVPYPLQLGMIAGHAAYEAGEPWLNELLDQLRKNQELIKNFISEHMPKIKYKPAAATYLAWLDIRGLKLENPYHFFLKNGVALSNGKDFGWPGFLRLNFATSEEVLLQALERLHKAYKSIN
ncbi:MAG: PatB family C-S lyase [Lentisphaeraceae bacterium]|nr:PatB family C-S lyase [Lentisphaeraceae bacterium]